MFLFNIIIFCFLFLPTALYMVADLGHDNKKLYEQSKKTLGIELVVCPLLKDTTKVLPKKRLELVCFYQLVLRQYVYIQPEKDIDRALLIEHIKSVFSRIDSLPAQGFHKVSEIVLLSVLLYHQLMVYYNCKVDTAPIQNQ